MFILYLHYLLSEELRDSAWIPQGLTEMTLSTKM